MKNLKELVVLLVAFVVILQFSVQVGAAAARRAGREAISQAELVGILSNISAGKTALAVRKLAIAERKLNAVLAKNPNAFIDSPKAVARLVSKLRLITNPEPNMQKIINTITEAQIMQQQQQAMAQARQQQPLVKAPRSAVPVRKQLVQVQPRVQRGQKQGQQKQVVQASMLAVPVRNKPAVQAQRQTVVPVQKGVAKAGQAKRNVLQDPLQVTQLKVQEIDRIASDAMWQYEQTHNIALIKSVQPQVLALSRQVAAIQDSVYKAGGSPGLQAELSIGANFGYQILEHLTRILYPKRTVRFEMLPGQPGKHVLTIYPTTYQTEQEYQKSLNKNKNMKGGK